MSPERKEYRYLAKAILSQEYVSHCKHCVSFFADRILALPERKHRALKKIYEHHLAMLEAREADHGA